MLFEIKKLFYGGTTHFREKYYNDDPPFMAILLLQDLFGTPILDIFG